MKPGVQIVLSGVLTFGVPLAFAVRELVALRRRGRGSWPGDGSPRKSPPPIPFRWEPSLPPPRPAPMPGIFDGPAAGRPARILVNSSG